MKKLSIYFLIVFFLTGCNEVYFRWPVTAEPPIILHPIEKSDIFFIPVGAKVEWDDMILDDKDFPGDLIYVEKSGYFVSEFYMTEIMEAKVK